MTKTEATDKQSESGKSLTPDIAARLLDRGVDGGGVWIHEPLHQPPSALIHRRRTFPPPSRPPA